MHMAMVLTTLWSGGASHCSLSRYVALLLAVKFCSSRRAQIVFPYRSELVVCLCKQQLSLICKLAYILGPMALSYFDELESPSPPINACTNISGIAQCWDSSSNSVCYINNQCMEMYPHTTYRKMVKYSIGKKSHKNSHENSHILENGLGPPCSILLMLSHCAKF